MKNIPANKFLYYSCVIFEFIDGFAIECVLIFFLSIFHVSQESKVVFVIYGILSIVIGMLECLHKTNDKIMIGKLDRLYRFIFSSKTALLLILLTLVFLSIFVIIIGLLSGFLVDFLPKTLIRNVVLFAAAISYYIFVHGLTKDLPDHGIKAMPETIVCISGIDKFHDGFSHWRMSKSYFKAIFAYTIGSTYNMTTHPGNSVWWVAASIFSMALLMLYFLLIEMCWMYNLTIMMNTFERKKIRRPFPYATVTLMIFYFILVYVFNITAGQNPLMSACTIVAFGSMIFAFKKYAYFADDKARKILDILWWVSIILGVVLITLHSTLLSFTMLKTIPISPTPDDAARLLLFILSGATVVCISGKALSAYSHVSKVKAEEAEEK